MYMYNNSYVYCITIFPEFLTGQYDSPSLSWLLCQVKVQPAVILACHLCCKLLCVDYVLCK